MINSNSHTPAGFTLIEILIAIAILSVAMLGSVQFAVKGVKNSKGQNLDYDFAILASNVGMVLQNDCDKVLKGQTMSVDTTVTLAIPPYTVASTITPPNFVGTKVTGISISRVSPAIYPDVGNGRHEIHATLTLQAKRFLANDLVDKGSPLYTKDYEIDAWVDTASKLISCQKQAAPTAAVLSFSSPVPAASCIGDPPIQGTWSVTNVVRNAYFAITPPATPATPDIQASPNSLASNSGPFTIPIPNLPGTYTYTLFVEDLTGRSTWATVAPAPALSFNLNVLAPGNPPCP